MTSLSDWFHFLRPNLWTYVIAVYIIAFLSSEGLSPAGDSFSLFEFAAGIAVFVMLCSASITVNHIFDAPYDRRSSQLYRFPVASGKISMRTAAFVSIMLCAVPVIVGLYLPANALYLIIFSVFMILAYSAPPLRIKERQYADAVWNGLGYGVVPFYLGIALFSAPLSVELHLLAAVLFFICASGHTLLQVRDIEDDRLASVKTTSTRHGMKKMVNLSGMMIVAAGIVAFYLAAVSFLSPLAFLSLAIGALIFAEHRRMRSDVGSHYRKLQFLYVIAGILFILSMA